MPNSGSPTTRTAFFFVLWSPPNSASLVSPPRPGSERPRLFAAAPRRPFTGSSVWLLTGSSCGSHSSPALQGTRARAHARAYTPAHTPASSLPAPHPPRRSSAGWGVVGVTSGLQSRGERLERDGEGAAVLACPETASRAETTRWRSRAPSALRSIPGLLEEATTRLAVGSGSRTSAPDSGPRHARPGDTPSPSCAFRSCAGVGHESAVAPGLRGAAASGRARRGEGAAASARRLFPWALSLMLSTTREQNSFYGKKHQISVVAPAEEPQKQDCSGRTVQLNRQPVCRSYQVTQMHIVTIKRHKCPLLFFPGREALKQEDRLMRQFGSEQCETLSQIMARKNPDMVYIEITCFSHRAHSLGRHTYAPEWIF
ncbi:PREDICTED: uncharacterized protein LOC105583875 [Cercocebus atys]|uniref:uncharacterized protein LOC105583875 n=1 Tax=Cercocebus atys TaxID=9531 RepID=UPI0005F4C9EE|nr:PREDICTED: uncharacterized protein LOC105583875 [Cercocebus atys]